MTVCQILICFKNTYKKKIHIRYTQNTARVANKLTNNEDDEKYGENLNKPSIPIKDTLTATNGKTVKSSVVFIAALRHLQKEAKNYLTMNRLTRRLFRTCDDSDIQWIITVPAIWNDDAKHKMRQWAIDAGLVDRNIVNQCKIVYEPDCASLAIQYEINRNELKMFMDINDTGTASAAQFQKGEKYVLVDAGGGTTDIACHEILADDGEYGVKEILHPSGGPWGSCYIDDQFVILLGEIFKPEWIAEFKEEKTNFYVQMIDNFQSAKAEFADESSKESHNVRLGVQFIGFIQDKLEDELDDFDDEDENDETLIEIAVSESTPFGQSKLNNQL